MSWQQIRGHQRQVTALQRAYRRGRFAHAYLLTGPGGVGKHTFAVELARALLCEAQPPGAERVLEACGHCPACVQVTAGSHPDFFPAVRPAESAEFPVDLMHELCHAFSLKSARGRGKVVLIDEADDFNEESANCFLKTLEEPPPKSVLLLIGSTPDRQLPTVVSRCQVLRFGPLAEEDIDAVLQTQGVGDTEGRGRLIRLAGGSPGMALALADPELWEFRGSLLDAVSQPRFDSVALGRSFLSFVETAGKESALQRRRAQLVVRLLIDFLGDALAVRVEAAPQRTDASDRPALQALAARAEPETLMALLERCLQADEQIERRVQLVLILESLLDAIAQQVGIAA
jgi:DNA polymerase-3 subunit delta'